MQLAVGSEVPGQLVPGAAPRSGRETASEVSLVFCSFCLKFTPAALTRVLLQAVVTRYERNFGLLGLGHSCRNTENASLECVFWTTCEWCAGLFVGWVLPCSLAAPSAGCRRVGRLWDAKHDLGTLERVSYLHLCFSSTATAEACSWNNS